MSHRAIVIRWGLAGLAVATAAVAAQAQPTAPAATPVKLGIVSFLTGPAASPFGIPGRNGAEIVIEALNAGNAPAPLRPGMPNGEEAGPVRNDTIPSLTVAAAGAAGCCA